MGKWSERIVVSSGEQHRTVYRDIKLPNNLLIAADERFKIFDLKIDKDLFNSRTTAGGKKEFFALVIDQTIVFPF